MDTGTCRSVLAVALRKDTDLLGYISVYRLEVRPFSNKQIALLENFAAQAVIAMENARLIIEQREALEQQTAIADVLRAINAPPGELTSVFDVIGEKAIKLCDAAAGALMLPDGDRFRAVALGGVPEAYAEFWRNSPAYGRPNPGSLPARMLAGDDVVHIKDITNVDEYAPADTPSARALAELGGGRTLLGVALRKDDNFFGMITIFRQEVRPFSDRQVVLLQSFAAQAVIAMENARLLEEVRKRQTELRITFENMGDGVAMFDDAQHLVAWNRKFQDILDVPDDIIAQRQTFSEYVRYLAKRGEYGADADGEEQVRRVLETAGQMRVFERVRPNGRVIEVRSNPVAGGGFVLIYADITERKRNEAEIRAARDAAQEASRTIEAAYLELKTAQANLIQAEKMASLGLLTAGIAHEIKNPLNFVNNFSALSTELIDELRDVLAPEPLGETARTEVDDLTSLLKGNLEKVVLHGQRADGIVRSMLDHSRGSSGERRIVDLNALIDEALNLAYHGARAQDQSFDITLERDFGEGIAPIEVNPQDITRVFLNIWHIWNFSERPFSEVQGTPRDEARIAVSLDDKDAMAHAVLAHIWMWNGEWEAAISEARAALTLNPNSAFVIGTLGCVLGFGGYRDEALDRLRQAMRASPHDPLTWLWTNWRACIQFYSRQFDAALETCSELARLRPEYGPVHGYIAGSLALLGRLDEARAVLERAGSRPPDPRWRQRPPWLRPEDFALRIEGLRLAAGETL